MELNEAADLSEWRRALERNTLELTYEKASRRTESLFEQESARRLHLQNIILVDENDRLCQELAQNDDQIRTLESVTEQLKAQIVEIGNHLQLAQGHLRAKLREANNLKAELEALNGVSVDSTKLLTEKLALTRELSNLKPELESLRTQSEAYQVLLSEKLSLQRQLGTTQLELETEKRATQRTVAIQEKGIEKDARLQNQIEELRTELAQERRNRQKVERDAQKEMACWEGKKAILEGKLDAFRNRLRTTKEQPKQTEVGIHKVPVSTATTAYQSTSPKYHETAANNRCKRSAIHLDMDATIGTPGLPAPAKRGKRASTLPGDKSTFSITPFLNRTASVAADTPGDEDGFEYASKQKDDMPPQAERLHNARHAKQSPSAGSESRTIPMVDKKDGTGKPTIKVHTLGSARTGKINTKAPTSRKRSVKPSLENVTEEQQDENEQPIELRATDTVGALIEMSSESNVPSLGEDMEQRKKKKKLLGNTLVKTLFDDDDEENVKAVARVPLGFGKGLRLLAKGGLAGPKGSTRIGPADGSDAFGSFSPLKKDKKANAGNRPS